MGKYGMSSKTGTEIIAKIDTTNLTTAYNYFSKLKNISLVEFKKIFIVIKL